MNIKIPEKLPKYPVPVNLTTAEPCPWCGELMIRSSGCKRICLGCGYLRTCLDD